VEPLLTSKCNIEKKYFKDFIFYSGNQFEDRDRAGTPLINNLNNTIPFLWLKIKGVFDCSWLKIKDVFNVSWPKIKDVSLKRVGSSNYRLSENRRLANFQSLVGV
jgi:hypothetical protein